MQTPPLLLDPISVSRFKFQEFLNIRTYWFSNFDCFSLYHASNWSGNWWCHGSQGLEKGDESNKEASIHDEEI
jgi:hypothetical protein